MKPFETVELTHNSCVSSRANLWDAKESIDSILNFEMYQKLKPEKILELVLDNCLIIVYELKNKRKEVFYIEND